MASRIRAVTEYFQTCARRLRLDPDRITILLQLKDASPKDGIHEHTIASCEASYGQLAVIRVYPAFFRQTPALQKATAAHELLHVKCSRVDDFCERRLRAHDKEQYEYLIEDFVVSMEPLLCELLPDPPRFE